MEWPKDRQGVGMHPFHRQPHSEALRALWAGGSDRPARGQRSEKSRRAVCTDSGVDFGKLAAGFLHRRPTWTKALLIETARRYTGVVVSRTTMGRVLKKLRARRGRPKPLAPCPW